MRRILIALCLLASLWGAKARGQAANVYLTQTGASTGACTSGVQSAAWFNNSANWGTGTTQIGPSTIVHLCGVVNSSLQFQGSGTSGHPITLFFETGGSVSQAFCSQGGTNACVDIGGKNWIIFDGGVPCGVDGSGNTISEATCNGKIEATANGTGLANHQSDAGGVGAAIWAPGTCNIELKNLDVRNIYVHTLSSDTTPIGSNGNAGITTNGTECNWHIHDSKFHDMLWALNFNSCSAAMTNIEIDHNDFFNTDHAIAIGIGTQTDSGILIHHNRIHDPKNWDASGTPYHHDGIHHFDGACGLNAGSVTSLIYSNLFDGDWGVSNTAHIFFEGHIYGTIFNNVFIGSDGRHLSNGSINNCNNPDPTLRYVHFYNNTLIYTTTTALPIELCGPIDVRNNVESLAETDGNTDLVSNQGSGIMDYNVYANPLPSSQIFTFTGSCCQKTYTDWKAAGWDAHSPAIQTVPAGLNTTTGVPSGGSPVIGIGTNLTALGIAALNQDKNGVSRPGGSTAWDIGAFTSSGVGPATPTNVGAFVVGP